MAITGPIADHLATAILVLDASRQVAYANSAAEQLLGLGHRRLLGCTLAELYQHLSADAHTLNSALSSNQGQTLYALSLATLDGQHHTIDLTVSPLPDDCRVIEARAIDQQQRISQELQQYAQHHAAQLLVRGLAHEIKNPLGGLRGAAQLLQMELEDSELTEFTQIIIEQSDRLRALVDRLLGPQYPGKRATTNVHRLLESCAQLCQLESHNGIQIERDYDPSIPDFTLDTDQLEQALLNICRNGCQAMQQQGKLTLKTRTHGSMTINGQRHRRVMTISIIDDGPGIAAEVRDTLFYPMVTNKADGSGLGLSIAQNIVAQHQGRIDVDSWPGHTEFIIYLPLNLQSEAPAA
ncbi:nitrogen regulation protein NR(II) [Ferrimonas senticii]|uniref:nitrogen regulation protein NR(II) n=1 Tax=Ferrimonas senticii TaxID=394566 RepID=UPI000421CA87|nr:nitrogen regulation protein NR(II) [Ferrimonas senticii]